jgi:carboxyl-terminal processing protease
LSASQGDRFIPGFVAGAVVAAFVAVVIVWLTGGFGSNGGVSTDAQDVIEQNYFRQVKPSLLDNASIDGMISTLKQRYDDRFSHYFDPREYRQFALSNSGEFSGVGLTVNGVTAGLRVASVLPGSPAKRANIKPNDVIVAVDGHSLRGVSEDVAVSRVKGPPGTPVTLTIRSGGTGKPRQVHLKRATVKLPVATGHIAHAGPSKVAYVRFATFSEGAHGELRDTIERLYREGAEGLLLDLRGNGGGLLNEAVLASSIFVEDGVVVSTSARVSGDEDFQAQGEAIEPRPTVVLINRDTASAAEILSAALDDYDLATLVGTRSYGKNTVQEVLNLPSGGALDLTIGEYVTSKGESLANHGVRPEVHAKDDPDTPADEGREAGLAELESQLPQ